MDRRRRQQPAPERDPDEPQARWARREEVANPAPPPPPPPPPQPAQQPQVQAGVLQELRDEIESLKKQISVKGELIEPLHISVKAELKEKIVSGKFVEFHELLKKSFKDDKAEDISGVDDGKGNFVFKAANNKIKKNLDIEKWCSAFLTFMSVYIQAHPDSAQDLIAYGEMIRGAARDHPGSTLWRDYDEQFRTRKAADPQRPFGMIDPQLWMSLFCRSNQPSTSSGSSGKGPCRYFNSDNGCRRKHCWYQHVCSGCKASSHPIMTCFKKGRKQVNTNSNQQNNQQNSTKKPFPFPNSKQ